LPDGTRDSPGEAGGGGETAAGAWDRYLKLWLLVVPSVIVALVIISIVK
jgi:hypothetical protein